MTRCATPLAAAVLVLTSVGAVHAQVQRNFPAHALRGEMTVVAGPEVRLNGRHARLAPGSRIRDSQNMLVLSGEIAGRPYTVHYTLDPTGLLMDVWLLRADEKRREPWPRTLTEASTWAFDELGQRWSKR